MVETVTNPTGYPAGVYTKIVWDIGDLPAGKTYIKYASGIPLKKNVMPTDSNFEATANLDNNTGGSTREGDTPDSATNYVKATGIYPGTDVDNNTNSAVTASDSDTVLIKDLNVVKTANTDTFTSGGIVTYSLKIQSSEYINSTGITLTDTLPNGLCPLSSTTNYEPSGNTECDPIANSDPTNSEYDTVTNLSTGGYSIKFKELNVDSNGVVNITYKARMMNNYVTSSTSPTASGDEFTNTVSLSGTTTPVPNQNQSDNDPQTVTNTDTHTLISNNPVLSKEISENVTPMNCDTANYTSNSDEVYSIGSTVCFKLRVVFPKSATRNFVLKDFFPKNMTYTPGSWKATSNNTLDVSEISVDESHTNPVFTLGKNLTGSGDYVTPNTVFEVTLSGVVNSNSSISMSQVNGNLAKATWQNTLGQSQNARDQVDFITTATAPLTVDKQVKNKNDSDSEYADSKSVKHGDNMTYRIIVKNDSTLKNNNAQTVNNIVVWDKLPNIYACDTVHNISNGGSCVTTSSGAVLKWALPVDLASQDTTTVTYNTIVSSSASISTTYTNTAGVRNYDTSTNTNETVTNYPQDNIDNTVPTDSQNVPQASDTANVYTQDAILTKTATTSITKNNNGVKDSVPGEGVTYTLQLTVPAKSTIYNGVLADSWPSQVNYKTGSVAFGSAGGPYNSDDVPAGVSLSGTNLIFPTTYTNSTDTDQVFQVTFTGITSPSITNTQVVANLANFKSTQAENTSSTVASNITKSVTTNIIQPSPTITKTPSTTTPQPGSSVTYKVSLSNKAGTLTSTTVL